ncbi:DUF4407 domain-containing protein [Polymorphospora sp. NPDC050346]|uniref:DUF4407 domain-containing protein n=1 Tax=Polymorphospora sp. NPDC050346 TaxID=3155780 RepID=UPI0033F7F9A9
MTSSGDQETRRDSAGSPTPEPAGGGVEGGAAPAPADPGPGRWLRVLAGVDEQLLSYVPTERARYTALGGVVLGTAVIAAFSMWNALVAVTGGAHVLILLPVLVWALFVLNLDRWLVSSSAGTQWRRRASVLLPRLLVAIFFGFVIAEPLVLRIFGTAIEQHIRDDRAEQLRTLTAKLTACNPVPGQPADQPAERPAEGCLEYVISFPATPAGVTDQLTALRTAAADLDRQIAADSAELEELNEKARRECAGDSGPGFTGRVGEGPNCRRLRGEADRFAASHPIAQDKVRLTGMQQRVALLEGEVRLGNESFEQVRDERIEERVAQMRSHHGAIGMLERFQALHELINANPVLFVTTWLIRIFFILIDCLPVLVKLFNGATAYDRLVDERVNSAIRIYSRATRGAEVSILEELNVRQYEAESAARQERDRIDLNARIHAADIQAGLDRAVEKLANDLRRGAREGNRPGADGRTAHPHLNGSRIGSDG